MPGPFSAYKFDINFGTGKSQKSEALIFASTNPKYEDRFFIELQVQCMNFPI